MFIIISLQLLNVSINVSWGRIQCF